MPAIRPGSPFSCPAADLWSDCGPSEARMADYIWYLFPLWQALSQNGYTVDFVSDKIVSQATFDDGKLHFGSQTYEAVIVPDVFSIEDFLAVRNLRFFGVNGGKIAFIGQEPMTGAGFRRPPSTKCYRRAYDGPYRGNRPEPGFVHSGPGQRQG